MIKRIRSAEYLEWQRKYMAEKAKVRKLNAIISLGAKCKKCESNQNLEIDHIDKKTKSFAISRPPSEKKFWEELKKCQLLCKKCHREKSTIEHRWDNCPHAKLSTACVKEILVKIANGHSGRSLAKEYGVGPMQISRIKHRKEWAHVI